MIWVLALAVGLLGGAMLVGLVIFAVVIHREEKAYTLTIQSPGWVASRVRAINGVYARFPGVLYQTNHHLVGNLASAGQRARRDRNDLHLRPHQPFGPPPAPDEGEQAA